MTDPREALVALVDATLRPFQVDPKRGPSDAVGAVADAILAAGWTPRGEAEDAAPTVHDHEWQRRQNVTSRGYRMMPYEVCVVDGCNAARQVDEPAAHPPTPPTVKPTLEQVVDVLAAQPPGRGEWTSSRIMQTARAVLALFEKGDAR